MQQMSYPNYINKDEEIARKFLQQYKSFNPVILLIDNIQQSHEDAYNFIKNLHKIEPKVENINFMLMKFNTSGASSILETTNNNRVRFEKLLNQPVMKNPSNFLGNDNQNKSAAFFGILNAVYLLPPVSGVIVFMKRGIEDEDLAQQTLNEVIKKRIRVFVVWGGRNEGALLKELAIYSDGAFLTNSQRNLSEVYFERFLENIGEFASVSTILSRKNLHGEYNLNFPIDSDVTGIHISITPKITNGILTTPKGYEIDVLKDEVVAQYSIGSFMKRDDGIHEIHLNTTTATTPDVGVWRFRVGNARAYYNITIFAHTKLTTNAFITIQNLTGNKSGNRKKVVKLGLTGDIKSISNISFVSRDGNPILDNVKFTLDKDWENYLTENVENIETNQRKEVNINVETIPDKPFYAVINGKDSRERNIEGHFPHLPPLTIEVGLGSELITQQFRRPEIYFEVTNNGNRPTLVRFFCRDEKYILLSMNPKWINPQETTTVRLTLITRAGSYNDLITFTAAGSETVSKNVIVDVGLNRHDKRDPELHYQFTSDCLNVLFQACEDGVWTVEVKAKDVDSGLLQVLSKPKGLYFPNGFTTGTTEEVTGYFSESCCNPDLKLVAFDRQNNRKTRDLNAYRANLGPGAIAAIVLGIIFLIIIIILIILLIKYKCKCPKCPRKTQSYDLPTYRGP
ncbi:uncharacterized protein BDFB_000657, partial [Asbolus verrucosus]